MLWWRAYAPNVGFLNSYDENSFTHITSSFYLIADELYSFFLKLLFFLNFNVVFQAFIYYSLLLLLLLYFHYNNWLVHIQVFITLRISKTSSIYWYQFVKLNNRIIVKEK